MDYGKLFSRAWDIIWKHKFLILLGVLVALGGTSGGGGNQMNFAFQDGDFNWNEMPQWDYGAPFRNLDLSVLAVVGIVTLVVVLAGVGLILWVAGTMARGGLISAVNDIEEGNPTDFTTAFRAAWKNGWRLLGIDLVPAIPGLALVVGGLVTFLSFGGFGEMMSGRWPYTGMGPFLPLILLFCLLLPIILVLALLRFFANRACMLEDLGVIAAYRRGFEVVAENLGQVLILYLIQFAFSIAFFLMMIVPGILMVICCLLWPLLLLVQAAFITYISILWTLAWREWVGGGKLVSGKAELVSTK
jgi:hypothetical protein